VAGDAPVRGHLVTEPAEQLYELGVAAMDITDDVEWPVPGPHVVPERLALHCGTRDLGLARQHVDTVEALAPQAAQAAPELAVLPR
jgi:uncharacterized protein (DUF1499 family)